MKTALLSVLEALLKTLKFRNTNGETVVEAMNLLRCIIRMVLKLLVEPAANKPVLIDTVLSHFRTAKSLVDEALSQKAISLIIKDVSWLWRTAYNCAVQGCSEWEGFEDRICKLFDIARDASGLCMYVPGETLADVCFSAVRSFLSGVAGRC